MYPKIMPLNEQRAVANVRERKRTEKLNQAYKQLQSIIPKEPSDKMSKIHTLRLALTYIDFLNNILNESDTGQEPCTSSASFDSGSSSQHIKSPCASSASSIAHVSATSEEEEEDEYQHQTKRAKFKPMPTSEYQSIRSMTPCYTTFDKNVTAQVEQLNCHSYQNYVAHNQAVSPSNSSVFYATGPNSSPDDMTLNLRNAFREFRTRKRKRYD